MTDARPQYSAATLGFVTAGLILLTIHLCLLISIAEGHFEACMPYWADCVSISRAGRHGLAYFVFKGAMLPAALLLGIIWQLARDWLQALGTDKGSWLPRLGWTASLALLIYTLSLGHSGDAFYILRRFGVVFYMGLTFIALVHCANALRDTHLASSGQKLLRYSAAVLSIAVFSLILDGAMGEDYDRLEDAFEWWLILLLIIQLFWLSALWRRTGLTIRIGLD